KTLWSASDAQRASFRRLLDSINADRTEGGRLASKVTDTPEAKVHWVTKHQFAIGIVISVAVAIFVASFAFTLNSLDNRINALSAGMETRFSTLETRLTSLETRLTSLETRLSTVETKIGSLETRLGFVETRISELSQEVSGLKSSIDRLLRAMDARSAAGASSEPSMPPNDPAGKGSSGQGATHAAGQEVSDTE
ncbi:MAG: hypothetical protein LBT40_17160, partial [Deltaproteobacteria bacterium]|nr:hypothetical protein [Deltaproteobacteria bacterium]